MLSRRHLLLAPVAALTACGRKRFAGFQGYAFIANEEGQAIATVDLTSFTLMRHIPVGGNPTAVIAHAQQPAVYALTPNNGCVHELDASELKFRRKVQVAGSAVSMRLSPDRESLWVLCRDPRQLVRLDLRTLRVAGRISLAADPIDFDIGPEGNGPNPSKWAAVSFGDQGVFSIVDLGAGRVQQLVNAGKKLGSVRARSDGKLLIAANLEDRSLAMFDVSSGRLVVNLPLGVRPDNLCFKADGGQLFVTGEGMDAVVIVYVYTTEVAETVLAGRTPGAMAALTTADYDYLFVANPTSGDVTILDVETRRAIAAVSVGREPAFIAITPDFSYALVLNRRSGDMSVIRVAAIRAQRARSAPLFTMIPVGSGPVSAAVRGI